jgi:hypothetical protein
MTDEDRVSTLIELQKLTCDQMSEVKREEIGWLKIFLLLYSAVIAWIVARWFPSGAHTNSGSPTLASDIMLLNKAVWFCFFASLMFAFLFIHTRHSYYGLGARLHQIQDCLHLFEPDYWEQHSFFPAAHSPGKVAGLGDWWDRTKPQSSFFTRIMYIVGANFAIDYLAYLAFQRMGSAKACFLSTWVLLNLLLLFGIYLYDYLHFTRRDAS